MKVPVAAYLYSDGHAVVCFEKDVRLGGSVTRFEYCEVFEKYTEAQIQFTGRLVFHQYHAAAFLRLAKIASRIECQVPSIDRGSDNTKRLGLAYSDLSFTIDGADVSIPFFKVDNAPVYEESYTSICSNGVTYQPTNTDKFTDIIGEKWADTPIVKVHRLPKEQTEAIAA